MKYFLDNENFFATEKNEPTQNQTKDMPTSLPHHHTTTLIRQTLPSFKWP